MKPTVKHGGGNIQGRCGDVSLIPELVIFFRIDYVLTRRGAATFCSGVPSALSVFILL